MKYTRITDDGRKLEYDTEESGFNREKAKKFIKNYNKEVTDEEMDEMDDMELWILWAGVVPLCEGDFRL